MGKDQSQVSTTVENSHKDPEEIRREIARTRAELGETVEALATKADVKGQAKQKVAEARHSASAKKDEAFAKVRHVSPDSAASGAGQLTTKARENPLPVAVLGGFVAGFVAAKLTPRH